MKEYPIFFVKDKIYLRFSPLAGEDVNNPAFLEVTAWELVKSDDTTYVTKSYVDGKWYGRIGSETLDLFAKKQYLDAKELIKSAFPHAQEYLPRPSVNFMVISVESLEDKNKPQPEDFEV